MKLCELPNQQWELQKLRGLKALESGRSGQILRQLLPFENEFDHCQVNEYGEKIHQQMMRRRNRCFWMRFFGRVWAESAYAWKTWCCVGVERESISVSLSSCMYVCVHEGRVCSGGFRRGCSFGETSYLVLVDVIILES
ncbi:hypothetical protein Hanom_Chr10g00922171 [Helianthus anomalus]